MISLIPIHEDNFAVFLKESIDHFIEDIQTSENISMDEAKIQAESKLSTVLPYREKTPGHYFFHIIVEEDRMEVGYFWLLIKEENDRKEAIVFDIMIHPDQRGKGYGKAAMLCGEDIVKEMGVEKIWLHVIAKNTIALALYRKLGYKTSKTYKMKNGTDDASYNMTKSL